MTPAPERVGGEPSWQDIAVGLFDQSSFAKFRLEGRDAARVLGRVCANDVDVAPGRMVYTQWLNDRGGIEADLTVTRA